MKRSVCALILTMALLQFLLPSFYANAAVVFTTPGEHDMPELSIREMKAMFDAVDFECLHEFRQHLPENIRYAGADGSLFPLKNKRLMGLLLPKYPFVLIP